MLSGVCIVVLYNVGLHDYRLWALRHHVRYLFYRAVVRLTTDYRGI